MKRVGPRNSDGAVTVEAAIVSVLVFSLLIMVFQGALFMRSRIAATDAASSGARAGAVAGTEPNADYMILQAIMRSTSPTARSAITSIVIFKADAPTFNMDPSCKTTPGPTCNVYTAADLSRPETDFGPGGWAGDDSWAASTRTAPPGTTIDIGVYVQLQSGALPPLPSTIDGADLAKLEPA